MTPTDPSKARDLIVAAIRVAASGPRRRDAHALKASVSHNALAELRGALDALGYDWRAVRDHRPTTGATRG